MTAFSEFKFVSSVSTETTEKKSETALEKNHSIWQKDLWNQT